MGVLSRALSSVVPEQKLSVGQAIPTWQGGIPQIPPALTGSYDRFAREGYMRNELIFAAVELMATSVAEPRLAVYRRTPGEPEELTDHPLLDVLEHPNPFTSRGMLWQIGMMHRALAGNVFFEKVRSRRPGIAELWPLRPDRVRIIPDAKTFIGGYEYRIGDLTYTLPPTDVIHFKNRHPIDDYYGMPPIQAAAGRIDTDNYMREYIRTFFTNAGVPAGLLQVKRTMNDAEREMIRARFRQDFAGPSGWHNLMVLENTEATYQAMGMPLGSRGMDVENLDSINEARIAMVWGIPLSLLGAKLGTKSSSYANRVADQAAFWNITLIPIYREFAAALTMGLKYEYDDGPDRFDYLDFNLGDVHALEEDQDALHTRIRADVAAGLLTQEEGRVALGLPPQPNKKDHWAMPTMTEVIPVTAPPPPKVVTVSAPPQLGPGQPDQGTAGGQQASAPPAANAREPGETLSAAAKTVAQHAFSTTQFDLDAQAANGVRRLARLIPSHHLAADGRATDPHLTVMYGLHTSDPSQVADVVRNVAPVTVTFGKTSVFPASENDRSDDGSPSDVVKVDVDSPALQALNQKVGQLPSTSTHPTYQPHVTVAYVKPGLGKLYAGRTDLEGQTATFDHLTFSDQNGHATTIPLRGTNASPPPEGGSGKAWGRLAGAPERSRRLQRKAGPQADPTARHAGLGKVQTAIESAQRQLGQLAYRHATGSLDQGGFVNQGAEVLHNLYRHALTAGMRAEAGTARGVGALDPIAVHQARDQRPYLEGLAQDVKAKAGEVTVEPGQALAGRAASFVEDAGLADRLRLYANTAYARYEQGRLEGAKVAGGEVVAITWNALPDCCDICAERDGQTYTEDDLPSFPGEGDFGENCAGAMNCRCWLDYSTADGSEE